MPICVGPGRKPDCWFSHSQVHLYFQYTRASTMLSVGGLRHQFSLPENVQMSMFMTEFLKDVKENLSVLGRLCFESLL